VSALPRVDWLEARSLDEVFTALDRPGSRIYAGGTDLLVALKERRRGVADVRLLVDVKSVAEARGITRRGDSLRIGAVTSAHELVRHPLVAGHASALREAAAVTASPALRHRATVGGNLTTPHPAGDVATALLALEAAVEIASHDGRISVVPVDRVLERSDGRAASEFIVAVRVPIGGDSAYEKLGSRQGFGRARSAVAVCERAGAIRVALANVGERPRIAGGTDLDEPFAALLERARRRLEGGS
jgi:carbon-monoxide dehydrogenase medium subunit